MTSLEKEAFDARHEQLVPGELKHKRYLSSFESDELVLDLRHPKALKPHLYQVQLSQLPLSGYGGVGVYQATITLGDFPHLLAALKIAINRLLARFEDNPLAAVPRHINNFTRIFSYLIRNGYYRLEQVPSSELTKLAELLAKSTWAKVLKYRRALAVVYLQAKADSSFASTLRGAGKSLVTLDIKQLENATGLKIPPNEISPSFRRRIQRLWSAVPPVDPLEHLPTIRKGANLQVSMNCMNHLSDLPSGFDGFGFTPFPTVTRTMAALRGTSQGKQTPNLDLPSTIIIFCHCCLWVYDRAPLVLVLLRLARDILSRAASRPNPHAWANEQFRNEVANSQGSLNLWFEPREVSLSQGSLSLKNMLEQVMVGVCCTIGINHGRRVNELAGEGLPYGLYFGCVTLLNRLPEDWRIEIYAEKGSQDWLEFPANRLIADCVHTLESISNELRAFTEPEKRASETLEERRRDFLISTRNLSVAGLSSEKSHSFSFRKALNVFLNDAGVSPSIFHGNHWPFRRSFCWLHTHRYDHPELLALSAHLDHLSVASTVPYQQDRTGRPIGGSINEILGKSGENTEAFLEELRQAQVAHLTDRIQDLLEGKDIGGLFARLVLKLAQKLSRNTTFLAADIQAKAATLGRVLSRHGYSSNSLEHTTCAASGAKATARLAKCFGNGRVRPELASSRMCSGCIHAISNEVNWQRVEMRRDDYASRASNRALPPPLRAVAKTHAESLSAVLETELKIAASNKQQVEKLVRDWEKVILV